MENLHIVILAAGQGTRMYSSLPKVLHPLAGKPLLQHVIETAHKLTPNIHIIYGHQGELVKSSLGSFSVNWIYQEKQLGTAHAVAQALPFIPDGQRILVLYGDVPLTSPNTLEKMLRDTSIQSIAWLTAIVKNPTGLGRIIRDEDANPLAIVEEKDATLEQKHINEINTGLCLWPAQLLRELLPQIKNQNAQNEYYLTDGFALAIKQGVHIKTFHPAEIYEIQGVNNKVELAQLERIFQQKQAENLMRQGVTLYDPSRFDLRGEANIGKDVTIDINVVLEGQIKIGHQCYIGPHCVLKNVSIADHVRIEANSVLEDCTVKDHASVGPFARLRPGTVLDEHAKVGNFVEVKKSLIGPHSKVNHLSYIGDATLGEKVNIGAGTITCNYDGVNKYQTVIEDGAFIGSNTSLVAPINIGKNATIGAGSTITKVAPAEQLTLARSKQATIPGWQRPNKKEE